MPAEDLRYRSEQEYKKLLDRDVKIKTEAFTFPVGVVLDIVRLFTVVFDTNLLREKAVVIRTLCGAQ